MRERKYPAALGSETPKSLNPLLSRVKIPLSTACPCTSRRHRSTASPDSLDDSLSVWSTLSGEAVNALTVFMYLLGVHGSLELGGHCLVAAEPEPTDAATSLVRPGRQVWCVSNTCEPRQRRHHVTLYSPCGVYDLKGLNCEQISRRCNNCRKSNIIRGYVRLPGLSVVCHRHFLALRWDQNYKTRTIT